MGRKRKCIDYAPAGCGPKGALIGAVRQAFYACVPALPPGEARQSGDLGSLHAFC
jgi:hypothetical protein